MAMGQKMPVELVIGQDIKFRPIGRQAVQTGTIRDIGDGYVIVRSHGGYYTVPFARMVATNKRSKKAH
jgi:ferredoxin-fold anticodon binding domain-containing protein